MAAAFGFDTADLIVLGVALLLAVVITARPALVSIAQRVAGRTVVCMAILGVLPIVLRLALLPHHPVPAARVADDFSYLLLGDTLAHFRLANPMHPMHRFFEGVFILQDPTYSSIYPLGQGLVLSVGRLIFGKPWAGVVLSVGLLCALCYWTLRGWVEPKWALLGGLLGVAVFGPLSSWTNTYWGGAVSGIAGCLVFGALPRLKNAYRTRDAVLLGAGLALQLLTRPFEFVLLAAAVLLFFVPARSLVIAAAVLLPAIGLVLLQNHAVTGSWTTLPYQLSRYQYGIPTTFTFQPNPAPHRALSIEQQVDYDAQTDAHRLASASYLAQLGRQVPFYRFFFLAPLYLAAPAFLVTLRRYRFAWAACVLAAFALTEAFYPFFYPHYVAAEASLFLLVAVAGLEKVSRFSREAAMFIGVVCVAHFIFEYGFRAGDAIDGDSPGRVNVEERLHLEPGRHLVFVHHSTNRPSGEWIRNQADIDRAQIVWAIDLGPDEDAVLRRYYPDRQAWLLQPDTRPPHLSPMP
jgi:hypothetical protein